MINYELTEQDQLDLFSLLEPMSRPERKGANSIIRHLFGTDRRGLGYCRYKTLREKRLDKHISAVRVLDSEADEFPSDIHRILVSHRSIDDTPFFGQRKAYYLKGINLVKVTYFFGADTDGIIHNDWRDYIYKASNGELIFGLSDESYFKLLKKIKAIKTIEELT